MSDPASPATATPTPTLGALARLPNELLTAIITDFLDVQSRARLVQLNSLFYDAAIKTVYSQYWHGDPLPPVLPDLPRLETLRLRLDGSTGFLHIADVHEQQHVCGAAVNLRPRTLVVRGVLFDPVEGFSMRDGEVPYSNSLSDDPGESLGDEVMTSIDRVVCVFDGTGHDYGDFPVRIRGKVTSLTSADTVYVFWTQARGERFLPVVTEGSSLRRSLTAVAYDIVEARLWQGNRFTLVNAGAISAMDADIKHGMKIPAWEKEANYDVEYDSFSYYRREDGPSYEDEDDDDEDDDDEDNDKGDDFGAAEPSAQAKQDCIEAGLRWQLDFFGRKEGLDDDQTRELQDAIRFITMDEYFAEPGLLDVFDPEELTPWFREEREEKAGAGPGARAGAGSAAEVAEAGEAAGEAAVAEAAVPETAKDADE
ncbi:hypothetical protein Q8F55_007955 [Vanrija albida]|uniref:F-box domain-containing protein n=1 Tax=Vanrija albida TaxID=181172 RepID=A0ABR3PUX3_9TREE